MDSEYRKMVADSLARIIEYERIDNKQIADLLLAKVWYNFDLHTLEADLVMEAIERLRPDPIQLCISHTDDSIIRIVPPAELEGK